MTNYSVLMSVYTKEKPQYLRLSIESILNQTLKPEQIVIVKDGPLTKELDSVIETYKNRYQQIFTIVPLEKNVGLGCALNYGIEKCRNELIARMDSDDICFPQRCEIQVDEFERDSSLSILGTQIKEFIDDVSNVVPSRYVPEKYEDIIKFSKRRSPFNHPTVMFKKSAIISAGGYSKYGRKEDLELFVKMVNTNYYSRNLSQPLLYYRTSLDNLKRRKSWINCKEYIQIMYKFYKKHYIGTFDILYVILGQLAMYIFPDKIVKVLSDNILRGKES